MKTSREWWSDVKANPQLLNEWLIKQHRGEVTASSRIFGLITRFGLDLNSDEAKMLLEVAQQEAAHASWILKLLEARGIKPEVSGAEERYWKAVSSDMTDFQSTAAIGAHAEAMRLERIRVISSDVTAPWDVREAFMKILPQEVWHEKVFRKLAGEVAMANTQASHNLGRELLGLVA